MKTLTEIKGNISQMVADDRISSRCATEIMDMYDKILAQQLPSQQIQDIIDCIIKFDVSESEEVKGRYFEIIQQDLKRAVHASELSADADVKDEQPYFCIESTLNGQPVWWTGKVPHLATEDFNSDAPMWETDIHKAKKYKVPIDASNDNQRYQINGMITEHMDIKPDADVRNEAKYYDNCPICQRAYSASESPKVKPCQYCDDYFGKIKPDSVPKDEKIALMPDATAKVDCIYNGQEVWCKSWFENNKYCNGCPNQRKITKSDSSKEEQAMYPEEFVDFCIENVFEDDREETTTYYGIYGTDKYHNILPELYQYWLNNIAKK